MGSSGLARRAAHMVAIQVSLSIFFSWAAEASVIGTDKCEGDTCSGAARLSPHRSALAEDAARAPVGKLDAVQVIVGSSGSFVRRSEESVRQDEAKMRASGSKPAVHRAYL